jgi:hypothetical protein
LAVELRREIKTLRNRFQSSNNLSRCSLAPLQALRSRSITRHHFRLVYNNREYNSPACCSRACHFRRLFKHHLQHQHLQLRLRKPR